MRVLEARDRIGGRVHTADLAGVPIDVGAAWLHGAHDNPLVGVANAYGFTHVADDVDDVALVSSSVSSLPERTDAPQVIRILETFERLARDVGPRHASMARLASELGISTKTIYRHFPTKDDLTERNRRRCER